MLRRAYPTSATFPATCEKLSVYLKNVTIDITDTKGFDAAQCTAGGIRTKEIYADTLKSRIVSGLYFAGEVIDIDGMCGGSRRSDRAAAA